MKTVKEVSRLAGVSVRTLHHYDHIGLLRPTQLSDSGYRLYDEEALLRLQEILLFRELEIPLKYIGRLLDGGQAEKLAVLAEQLQVLQLRKKQLTRLISLTQSLLKGEKQMDFTAFDTTEIQALQEEAKAQWGETAAYQAFASQSESADFSALSVEMMGIFKAFVPLMELDVTNEAVTAQVKALQTYISEHFYLCTDDVLASLGMMYGEDNRFQATIDQHAGTGVNQFVSQAIAAYVKKG